MIKRIAYMMMASLFAMSLPVSAQEITEEPAGQPVDSTALKIDSLTQVVNTLSSNVKKVEDEARDKKIWKDRAKYFNLYYVNQSLTQKDVNGTWQNDLGAALAMGRTYYLHKKALLGMIKFGLDWSYFDLNFSKYQDKFGFFSGSEYNGSGSDGNYYYENDVPDYGGSSEEEIDKIDLYQVEVGMGIGPSVTINPVNHLKVSGYFHVTPSMSLLLIDGDVNTSYGTFFSAGGAIAYKAISIGVEGRWGTTKYSSVIDFGNLDEEEWDTGYDDSGDIFDSLKGEYDGKTKWKTGSVRFYISFRY